MRYIKLLAGFLFLIAGVYAQPVGGGGRDPRWVTVGSGAAASRPATCTALRDVYICVGAGCTNGLNIHYCRAANTWQAQGMAGEGSGTDTGTTSTTFQIDSGNTGPKLKHEGSGVLSIRNAADDAYAGLLALYFETSGSGASEYIFTEGVDPSAPAAGKQTMFVDSADHLPKLIDSASAVNVLAYTSSNITGTAANLSGTPALPDGTTATTQSAADNSPKLATTAYADAAAAARTGTIASGDIALATAEIASGACTAAQTDTATGVATTDAIMFTPNADITGVTGYAPSTSGGLAIYPYPTANTVNFKVCNPTSSAITPGAVTLNWRVVR